MKRYLIKVQGQLDGRWSDWFDGLTIAPQANGETWLEGVIMDQPALHGMLKKLRDLGLPILLVEQLSPHERYERDENID